MSAPSAVEMYRAAQDLIREGQPVFPCRATGEKAKAPLTKNGLNDATTDLAQIKRWWQKHRDAVIGIPTGIQWDVLDVDTKSGIDGRAHLPKLQRLGLLNGCKRVVKTPSGGWHLYFQVAPGMTNKSSRALGLDVRSAGGYVLAPPSFIDTGEYAGAYEDLGPTTGSTDEPLMWDLIQWVLAPVDTDTRKAMELPTSYGLGVLRQWVANLKPGERNPGLYWAASRCIDDGYDPNELVEAAVLTGLGEEEVITTINSALKRAGKTPGELSTEAESLFGDS